MAKQAGEKKLIGTIQNVTFYKMGDEYYARMKSSLTGERFFSDAAFAGSRRSSERLALGSRMASLVYRSLPEARRYYALYRELKSLAIRLLKTGEGVEKVLLQLDSAVRKAMKEKRKARILRKRQVQRRRMFAPKENSLDWQIRRAMRRAERREAKDKKVACQVAAMRAGSRHLQPITMNNAAECLRGEIAVGGRIKRISAVEEEVQLCDTLMGSGE